jgi:hypothetical protein
MIALTQSMFSDQWALVADGQRFEFTAEWGPLLADMLDGQWPECMTCEDRSCAFCQRCVNPGCDCRCEPEESDEPPSL